MDNIMYEKLNIGPTLYFNEKLLLLMTHHEETRLNALP